MDSTQLKRCISWWHIIIDDVFVHRATSWILEGKVNTSCLALSPLTWAGVVLTGEIFSGHPR